MTRAAAALLSTLAVSACAGGPFGRATPVSIETGHRYHVEGARIVDGRGRTRVFRGVDRPSLEWTPRGEHLSEDDYRRMAAWGADVVRISLCQDFWLRDARRYDPSYQATVAENVAWAERAGLDVILVLHWSDGGDLSTEKPGMHRMPDQGSLLFWRELARVYATDPRVLFELYNEPHDVSWEVWQNGGDSGEGYVAVGMQPLHDVVRATGAENLVLVGGLGYAYDLSGVPTHSVRGRNVVYVTHPYDHADKQPDTWDRSFGFLASTAPVMATELGSFRCEATYDESVLAYAEAHGMSWSAWGWYPGGCSFPALITDWHGSPSVRGEAVRRALQMAKGR